MPPTLQRAFWAFQKPGHPRGIRRGLDNTSTISSYSILLNIPMERGGDLRPNLSSYLITAPATWLQLSHKNWRYLYHLLVVLLPLIWSSFLIIQWFHYMLLTVVSKFVQNVSAWRVRTSHANLGRKWRDWALKAGSSRLPNICAYFGGDNNLFTPVNNSTKIVSVCIV